MIKKRLKWVVYFAAPIALLAVPFGGGWSFKGFFNSIVLQPQKTGISTFNFYDAERDRPLTTEIWYPVDPESPSQSALGIWQRCDEARDAPISLKQDKYPLIVLSHGFAGDRFNLSWLAEILTANGFIVAAMDHYGNTWNNKIPACCATPWERPLDVSFVLDQILTQTPFKDWIDTDRIGFAGHSLGGATGIWIAGAETFDEDIEKMRFACVQELSDTIPADLIDRIDFKQGCRSFKDSRFKSMFVMAPALGWIFQEKSLESIDIPVYIVSPEHDEIVPFENNGKIYAKKIARSSLLILRGDANHYVFLNRATLFGKRFINPKYCFDPKTIDRRQVQENLAKIAVEFFEKELR